MIAIQEIRTEHELFAAARIIRESFATVAEILGLTSQNCPSHPSFTTDVQVRDQQQQGLVLYGLLVDEALIGVVGLKPVSAQEYSLERLAVLPDYRHRGYGEQLVRHCFARAREAGAEKISIGVIDEHTVLKAWYRSLGFTVTDTKQFPQLPFTVCFMECAV